MMDNITGLPFIVTMVGREKIMSMLKEEQTIRYSKNIQTIYTEQFNNKLNDPTIEPVNIEREIQKFILRKNGYSDAINSLEEYWKIPSLYWDDEEVKNCCFYMKLNIFKNPSICCGEKMVDATVIDFSTRTQTSLTNLSKQDRPLVILSGSMT
jgi:hypothetical protein